MPPTCPKCGAALKQIDNIALCSDDFCSYFSVDEVPSFTCPRCGAVSHHPKDIEHGYCGRCHDFTGDAIMSASMYYKPGSTFQFMEAGEILFTIRADGTIERGPCFTTTDEMSLKFWEAVERERRPLLPIGPR